MNDKEKFLREKLGDEWYEKCGYEFSMDYMQNLSFRIAQERVNGKIIFPKTEDIFNAFKYTQYSKTKVVILGADPYHSVGSDGKTGIAHGLSFSSNDPATCPPSLENIFIEIEKDIMFGLFLDQNCNLKYWADQGVFLLNKVLTVEKGKANSHKGWGWEVFTMKVIKELNKHPNRLVFMLWGSEAREYSKLLDHNYHLVLEADHPIRALYNNGVSSFNNCKHFSLCNKFLKENGMSEINW